MENDKISPALDRQVGGSHYKDFAIQPVEFIHANNLPFLDGCIVKRICRWRKKGGIQDLEKIKHEVDLLIQLELRKGSPYANKVAEPAGDARQYFGGVSARTGTASATGQAVQRPNGDQDEHRVDNMVHPSFHRP